jgi:hypothetical protein
VSTVLAWVATGATDELVTGLLAPFAFDLVFFAAYVAVTHSLVLLLLRSNSAGLSATLRIVAYGQVSQLVNWLPSVGLALGLAYGSVLAVIGVRRMHGASLGRLRRRRRGAVGRRGLRVRGLSRHRRMTRNDRQTLASRPELER